MKRRKFLQSSFIAASAITTGVSPSDKNDKGSQKELYELREYEMRFGSDHSQLENFFRTALIPALNKQGVKTVGVFKEFGKSEPAKVYLLIPYPSMDDYLTVNSKLKTDADYIKNSQAYNSIPADKPVYSRYSSSFMIAFDVLPKMVAPANESRIFELRTYEGYSEDALRRKIKMFNDGEVPIFNRAKLIPVFFGEVISGKNMPCLTYMITCKSMEDRDKGWTAFSADPDWKKLSADPQYANSVSNILKTFLVPADYSQI
ncbi:MAG: family containing protein [Chitinophagaceae bacterium]|nr:family containing protein [Chitinophagaceae bacterium]